MSGGEMVFEDEIKRKIRFFDSEGNLMYEEDEDGTRREDVPLDMYETYPVVRTDTHGRILQREENGINVVYKYDQYGNITYMKIFARLIPTEHIYYDNYYEEGSVGIGSVRMFVEPFDASNCTKTNVLRHIKHTFQTHYLKPFAQRYIRRYKQEHGLYIPTSPENMKRGLVLSHRNPLGVAYQNLEDYPTPDGLPFWIIDEIKYAYARNIVPSRLSNLISDEFVYEMFSEAVWGGYAVDITDELFGIIFGDECFDYIAENYYELFLNEIPKMFIEYYGKDGIVSLKREILYFAVNETELINSVYEELYTQLDNAERQEELKRKWIERNRDRMIELAEKLCDEYEEGDTIFYSWIEYPIKDEFGNTKYSFSVFDFIVKYMEDNCGIRFIME